MSQPAIRQQVAFFNTKNDEFRTMELSVAELESDITIPLSRHIWKTQVDVYVETTGNPSETQFFTTLNLWELGISYNVRRWLRSSSKLYVKCKDCYENLDSSIGGVH
jgi:hypothetical protein